VNRPKLKVQVEEEGKLPRTVTSGHGPVGANDAQKLARLAKNIGAALVPLDALIQKIEIEVSATSSEWSVKRFPTVLAKRKRERRKKGDWFDIEHIRDALRFRNAVKDVAHIEKLIGLLADDERFSIVKLDLGKFLEPEAFGWRFVAVDLREAESGQIVEYYFTFPEMLDANRDPCHAYYEAARDVVLADASLEDQLRYDQNLRDSKKVYSRAWAAALESLHMTETELGERWALLRRTLGR